MSRILITGAGSFIGSNFIKYSEHKEVREVSLIETKPADIDFREVDVVIHLAAIVHQTKKIEEQEYYRINRDMCIEVSELARKGGVGQFIYLSTIKVYGQSYGNSVPRTENTVCHPDDAYGKSKYAAEVALKKMNDPNFIVSIIRTPLVYGEGVKANMRSLIRLVDTLPFLPFARVENKRNFTFVENLVGYIDRVIELKAPGIFIAMDDNPLTITELVTYISDYLGKKVYLFKLPDFFLQAGKSLMPGLFDRLYGSLVCDNTQTKKTLSYHAPFSSREGIRKTVLHYLQTEKH